MLSMLSVEHKSSPINQSSKVYQARPTKCCIFFWLSLKDLQSLPAILSDVLKQWSTPQFVHTCVQFAGRCQELYNFKQHQ